jgi:hypothetical protein
VLHQELIDAEINAKNVFHQCQSADGEGQTAQTPSPTGSIDPSKHRAKRGVLLHGQEGRRDLDQGLIVSIPTKQDQKIEKYEDHEADCRSRVL